MADPQTVAPSLLSFAVVAAFVTTVGTLFGHILKEAILAKYFELWKRRQALETLYGKYRDPIVLSAIELTIRLNEACNEHPAEFLTGSILSSTPPEPSHSSVRDLTISATNFKAVSIGLLPSWAGWSFTGKISFFWMLEKTRRMWNSRNYCTKFAMILPPEHSTVLWIGPVGVMRLSFAKTNGRSVNS